MLPKRQANIKDMTTAVDKLLKTIRDRATDNFTTKLAKYMGKGTLALHPLYRCDTFHILGCSFRREARTAVWG